MLIPLYSRIKHLVSVPGGNDDLLKAQFEVFSNQVPLMYCIVLINSWVLAITFYATAPLWLSIYVPVGFSVVCGARIASWWRSRHIVPTAESARKALMRTNGFAFLLCVILTSWATSLYPYGDAYMQGNIAFFIAITGVGVIVCLQQMPSAAFIAAFAINAAFIACFCLSGITSFVGMAVNSLLVSIAMLMVVRVQFRYFSGAVSARSRLEAVNMENARLAKIDSLTGLANRRQFFAHLEETFSKAESRRLAVGVLDLDGFKPINDLYGHMVGDELLVEVGLRLAALADETIHVSRLGGDEFALTVMDCPGDDELLALGERVCAALRIPFNLADATVQISGSIGFAVFPELACSAKQLYERADYALYQSKRSSRGHALLFSDFHIVEIEKNVQIEQALSQADLEAEMTVVFQPIIDVQTQQTRAFEALARWTSPEVGNVSPGLFIPVAERIGLVNTLTCVLLRKALTAAASWPENIGLSFNLSTHDISSSDSIAIIVGIIMSSGVDPRRLDLEITETAVMYDFNQAKAGIEIFKRLGCGIALDDFGTGYSNLSQLHALPLTKIKIDRSFVTDLDQNPASYKIVKSLLALSSDMGLGCVIEGVETKQELAAVKQLGGRLVQGYYFSPPVSQIEAEKFLPDPSRVQKAG
ncbi:diguanylate cyclase (GGDEF) domain-containing protein [Hoeflea sp. IMCC20628]|uniref:putative bifunctional diguanylate cyclase/phosphodiesterase n=1 Tax=Hoeflea sp. IMCC20628 TaxID=1620421 RepID=UPI00063BD861|nr:EAL domain-containing protein [Hoeflea sp. IMCC20628]AKI02490.1 diguanylate cyclase (GGDEF) domain-containing protein [Hoeflea sp. IMCC20628]